MVFEEKDVKLAVYRKPEIELVIFSVDVITESHNDPNMGEWDTDI